MISDVLWMFSDVFRCSQDALIRCVQMFNKVLGVHSCSWMFSRCWLDFLLMFNYVHRMFSGFLMISDPKVFSNRNFVIDDSNEFDDP